MIGPVRWRKRDTKGTEPPYDLGMASVGLTDGILISPIFI